MSKEASIPWRKYNAEKQREYRRDKKKKTSPEYNAAATDHDDWETRDSRSTDSPSKTERIAPKMSDVNNVLYALDMSQTASKTAVVNAVAREMRDDGFDVKVSGGLLNLGDSMTAEVYLGRDGEWHVRQKA